MTDRLRLEPVTTGHAADLHAVQADPWVAEWYAGTWSAAEAKARAGWFERQWEVDGVSKWLTYRRTGELVGRGGLSRLAPDDPIVDRITALLDDSTAPLNTAAAMAAESVGSVGEAWRRDRLELGWALTEAGRGQGFAGEIGRAGLELAFGGLGAKAVVAFTDRHNVASRAVMARLGMTYAGEFTAEGLREGGTNGQAESGAEDQAEVVPDAVFALFVIGPDFR